MHMRKDYSLFLPVIITTVGCKSLLCVAERVPQDTVCVSVCTVCGTGGFGERAAVALQCGVPSCPCVYKHITSDQVHMQVDMQ